MTEAQGIRRLGSTLVQQAALAVGAAFLLAGVAGFIPGLTTNFDDLELWGHESGAKLLGLFEVSVLHNLIHIGFGVAGLVLARTAANARAYLVGGGLIYLVVMLYGVLVDEYAEANFVPLNDADNWLHLVLGGVMLVAGLVLGKRAT